MAYRARTSTCTSYNTFIYYHELKTFEKLMLMCYLTLQKGC